MQNILYAVLVLGILGAIFGAVLAVAAKIFHVERDHRIDQVREAVAGANCGACGYPGCDGYAVAVVAGEAPVNSCTPGGTETAAKIAAIMGVNAGAGERYVAKVLCAGTDGKVRKQYGYEGIEDCLAASRLQGGGDRACPFGCLGYGNCVVACQFGAMSIVDGIAHVDRDKCTGCMACVEACPKRIIAKVPYGKPVTVLCSSKQKGVVVRKVCDVGCIACGICVKVCPSGAITVTDNLATIDYSKCTECGFCAQKCPRKIILDLNATPSEAEAKAE